MEYRRTFIESLCVPYIQSLYKIIKIWHNQYLMPNFCSLITNAGNYFSMWTFSKSCFVTLQEKSFMSAESLRFSGSLFHSVISLNEKTACASAEVRLLEENNKQPKQQQKKIVSTFGVWELIDLLTAMHVG